ncbi:hypothetical protein RSOLAG22IIIB_12706 [Rhizoctonia solani]|uniref:Uncharacterized protein n=1 Tax=Rhizoctonia solani TaxID=456999 RepID=A0A0K6GFU2_9AGAM|nr:hypothetical protein RSOLAG22IIIB_12706 [Rhizoctonia solani]
MDRRVCIDHLITHIFESDGIKTLKYGTEQKIKLPKAEGFKVATATTDGIVYMDVPGFQPYDGSAEFRDCGSAFVPKPKRLKVIHCVAEYKEGSGKNQALMGIVSGLYQKRILRKGHQLVFAIFHEDIDILRVVAGGWEDGWIHLYQVGNYSLRNPLQAIKFYLVIRCIRQIGQHYLQELRQSEMQLEIDLTDDPPVDEWAKEEKGSTSEDLNEPDGNGPNEQPGRISKYNPMFKV